MTREERMYDSELYGGCLDGADPPAPVCPECGAVLDSDDDLLYESREEPVYVVGCSRCVRHRAPGWEEL